MAKRISPADMAVNALLVLLSATAAILLCIFLFSRNTPAKGGSAEVDPPHVIGTEQAYEPVWTTASVTTVPKEEETSDTETTTEPIPVGIYDKAFFDNALFIGDSLSVGLIGYEFADPEKVFAQAGITPDSVMKKAIDDVTVYDKVRTLAPERICVMLGTNGLAYVDAEKMAEDMGEVIDELIRLCPDAEIVIVSVPPVTKKHEEEKPEKLEFAVNYNEKIKALAEEKNVAYADSFSLLRDETGYLGDRYAEQDGLHLKIHAYPVILGAIENAMMEFYDLPPMPETETETETSPAETGIPAAPAAITEVTTAIVPEEAVTAVPETSELFEEFEEFTVISEPIY